MTKLFICLITIIFSHTIVNTDSECENNALISKIDSLMNAYGYLKRNSECYKPKDFYIIHSASFANKTFTDDEVFNFSEIALPDTTNICSIDLLDYFKDMDSIQIIVHILQFNSTENSVNFYNHLESYTSREWFYMTKDKQVYFLKDNFIVFVRSDDITNKYAKPIAKKLNQEIK